MEPNHSQSETNNEQSNPQVSPPVTTTPTSESKSGDSGFDFSEQSVMAALSYIGPLVIIPFLTNRENPFVLFHIKQGLVLFALIVVISMSSGFLWFLFPIFMLINLGLFILAIIGVINALQRKEVELPIIGKFSSHIKLQ